MRSEMWSKFGNVLFFRRKINPHIVNKTALNFQWVTTTRLEHKIYSQNRIANYLVHSHFVPIVQSPLLIFPSFFSIIFRTFTRRHVDAHTHSHAALSLFYRITHKLHTQRMVYLRYCYCCCTFSSMKPFHLNFFLFLHEFSSTPIPAEREHEHMYCKEANWNALCFCAHLYLFYFESASMFRFLGECILLIFDHDSNSNFSVSKSNNSQNASTGITQSPKKEYSCMLCTVYALHNIKSISIWL